MRESWQHRVCEQALAHAHPAIYHPWKHHTLPCLALPCDGCHFIFTPPNSRVCDLKRRLGIHGVYVNSSIARLKKRNELDCSL